MIAAEYDRKNVKVNKPKIRQSWEIFLVGHPFSSFSDSLVLTNRQAFQCFIQKDVQQQEYTADNQSLGSATTGAVINFLANGSDQYSDQI